MLSTPRPGLTTAELAPYLAPQRAGDPLGLGLAPGERPQAPPDPDKHDRESENASFARSLLSEEERRELDADIERDGFMPIAEVRAMIAQNVSKESLETGGLDPEMLALIDARIDYKLFIAGDNVYTRDELYDNFPFHEFGVQPEAIFVAQEIGVFPPPKASLTEAFEYVVRDVGDESVEFVMIEDLVRSARTTGMKRPPSRAPIRVARTKVYIGKERWNDFILMQRFFRGAARVATAQIAYSGSGSGAPAASSPLLAMFGGGGASTLRLTDGAEAEERMRRREAEAERALAEARRATEEANRAAEEARRATEETERRLAADIARIETMMRQMNSAAGAKVPVTPSAKTKVEPGEDDSVPL
ncbi:MAG: hypothetical protein WC700_10185 [Gemmatimonadaceae bacterium]